MCPYGAARRPTSPPATRRRAPGSVGVQSRDAYLDCRRPRGGSLGLARDPRGACRVGGRGRGRERQGGGRQGVETQPDVAIVDYSLPMMNGVEATRQIRARLPQTEVLIFTMHDSDVLVGEVLEAGARAYLLKSDAKQYLIAAVEALAAPQAVLHRTRLGAAARHVPGDPSGQDRRVAVAAGARGRAIDRGGSQQQGDERGAQSQHQDDRDAPRRGDAQAQRHVDRRARPLRHPQQAGGAVNHRCRDLLIIGNR